MKIRNTMALVGLTLLLTACASDRTTQTGSQSAQIPELRPNTRIQDFAEVLAADQEAGLQAKTQVLKDSKDIDLGVITIGTTGGLAPVDFATAAGRKFGIGSAEGEHRGIVLLLAINDRQCFISPSRHLEGVYTDGRMGDLCRDARTHLRAQDYNGALTVMTDKLIGLSAQVDKQQVQGVASDQQRQPQSEDHSVALTLTFLASLPIGLALALWFFVFRRRRRDRDIIFNSRTYPARPVTPRPQDDWKPQRLTPQILSTPTSNDSSRYVIPDPPKRRQPAAPSSPSSTRRSTSSSTARSRRRDDDDDRSSFRSTSTYESSTPSYEPPSPSPSSSSNDDSGFGGQSEYGGGGGGDNW